ncbi:carbohydrate-binding protein with CBM35 doain [Streptomyces sp. SLBN-118]|uniref:CBM35 domain-containing protein n=1 Tax=Streptomyces sp. SLBN-118 TaxID=2768454 RepID=UPI001152B9F0|nr:CBM35 domain-containing protein [Streptomyces sp. SLBN-118]TQK45407.1 carbohydrate-binding protein with CBM35 doain [Streptomyces sp. SLBN-118]
MTAANNGASTPEDDDPFGYLYEDGRAAGATPPGQSRGYGYPGPAAQPGVPRTSYNQVRTVGERQYGQQVPQQQVHAQQGQPTAQYAAPETYPGATTRQVPVQSGGHGGGRSGGPNTKGLLIGAIAVVAVVVIGIAAALMSGGGEKDKAGDQSGRDGGTSAGKSVKPSDEPTASKDPQEPLPKQDAATLQLGAPAALAKDIKGAEGAGGAFVTGFNAVGASVTWKANIAEAGKYRLYVRYSIPAQDANATLTVNGKANTNPLGLKNFIHSSDPAWEKNWQTTWAPVDLNKGENELKISCEAGNQCNVILDWLEVKEG